MVTPNGPDDRGEKDVHHEQEPTSEHGELQTPRNERGEQWQHGEQDGELDEHGVRREPRRMPGGVQRSVIGPTGD